MSPFRNLAALLAATAAMTPAFAAPRLARASDGQRLQAQLATDVPHCPRKLGTLSIANGDDPSGWSQFSLDAPSKLLKVLVARSGCFSLVDRGTGLNAAKLERDIGGDLGLQRRSNVGQGQIRAADYVLVAEVQGANSNVSGGGIGAGIGGLIGGRLGMLAGGIGAKKMEANTVLSLTNVRTTETIATQEGYAAKRSLSFGGGAGQGFLGGGIGAVGGGYDNTDIGRIVTLSFIQAYSKLVTDLGLVQPGAAGTAEAAPKQSYTAVAPVTLRKAALASAAAVRSLPPGATLFPTGEKQGAWWQVADDNDNVGWVLQAKLEPARGPAN